MILETVFQFSPRTARQYLLSAAQRVRLSHYWFSLYLQVNTVLENNTTILSRYIEITFVKYNTYVLIFLSECIFYEHDYEIDKKVIQNGIL